MESKFDQMRRMIEDEEKLKRVVDPFRHVTDAGRMVIEAEEKLRRLVYPFGKFHAMEDEIKRTEAMKDAAYPIRKCLGPIQDHLQRMHELEARFRLPESMEITRLVAEFQASPLSETLRRYAEQESSLPLAMIGMLTPWLDAQGELRSISGFAKLQAIGHALSSMPAFSDDLESALRTDLGDWRDRIIWPSEIFSDSTARSDFYISLGFDPALTDFPAPAFEQSLGIAGLRREPPPLVARYGRPVPRSDDEDEEECLVRTNLAHDWLLRLETQLRRFIDEKMTLAFGSNWPKHRLPNGMYERWREKSQKDRRVGSQNQPLIAYADFTDYEPVVCRGDNWREVFAPFFGRPESVRVSFQRLYPIRVDTMHARPITQDDELLLRVETKQLMKAMTA